MGRVVEYRGYTIRKSGNGLAVSDSKGNRVVRLETLIVYKAKKAIDSIIDEKLKGKVC